MAAIKVLIIDDEPETVSMLKAFFEMFNLDVACAYSGLSGMKAVSDYKPDVLILDLMLPDMDGYVICRLLRRAPETRKLPLIILSARTTYQEVKRGYVAGATRYLKKPVSLDLLLEEIRTLAKAAQHRLPSEEKQEEDASSPPTGTEDESSVDYNSGPGKGLKPLV